MLSLEIELQTTCKPCDWTNYAIMESLYKYYLKRQTLSNINWYTLFEK
jgi:hypothetical protein